MTHFSQILEKEKIANWSIHYIDYSGLESKLFQNSKKIKKHNFSSFLDGQRSRNEHSILDPIAQLEVSDDSDLDDMDISHDVPGVERTPVRSNSSVNNEDGNGTYKPLIIQHHHLRNFCALLDNELGKVNAFFLQRVATLSDQSSVLHSQLDSFCASYNLIDGDVEDKWQGGMSKEFHSSESLKRAYIDLHRQMMFLQSFCMLNYTGFIKIIKKHDKYQPGRPIKNDYMKRIKDYEFSSFKALGNLIDQLERTVADSFCEGSIGVARATLLKSTTKHADMAMLKLGMHFGMVIVFVFWVMWDCIVDANIREDSDEAIWLPNIFRIYTSSFSLILLGWCWGASLYIWRQFKINYVYIFQLDSRKLWGPGRVFKVAMAATIVYLLNLLFYFKTMRGELIPIDTLEKWHLPPGILPFLLYLLLIAYFIRVLTSNRFFWSRVVLNVIFAPFGKSEFLHSYIADVLTSTVKVMGDVIYSICYMGSGFWLSFNPRDKRPVATCYSPQWHSYAITFASALPLWFRLFQNVRGWYNTRRRFPYLVNAFKYLVAGMVVLFGGLANHDAAQTAFYFTVASSTLYSYTWDILMDWGLCKCKDSNSRLLRPRLMYKHKYYYVAMVLDLFLRFAWVLSLVPIHNPLFKENVFFYLSIVLAPAEILRRTMWGFFRVEHEHLKNTKYFEGDFVPLHFDSELAKENNDEDKNTRSQIAAEIFAVFVIVTILIIFVWISQNS